jgi:hypothetical protein
MTIAAGHPLAQIFVEGQLRGVGNASIGDLLPAALGRAMSSR